MCVLVVLGIAQLTVFQSALLSWCRWFALVLTRQLCSLPSVLLLLRLAGDALENSAASSATMARQELAWDLPGNDPLSCGNDGCGASGAEYARRPKQSVMTHTFQ